MGDLTSKVLEFMRNESNNRINSGNYTKDGAKIFSTNDIYDNFDSNHEDIDDALRSLVDNNYLEKWIIGSYKLLDED